MEEVFFLLPLCVRPERDVSSGERSEDSSSSSSMMVDLFLLAVDAAMAHSLAVVEWESVGDGLLRRKDWISS